MGYERIFNTDFIGDSAAKYTLGVRSDTGGAMHGPELVTDEERKDRGRREKKGLAARNFQSASCLKQNRNWRGGMEEGLEQLPAKEGAPSPQGKPGPLQAEQTFLACMPSPRAALLGVRPQP